MRHLNDIAFSAVGKGPEIGRETGESGESAPSAMAASGPNDPPQPAVAGRIVRLPIQGTSASGTSTEPSARW